jgi:hypothetical protein
MSDRKKTERVREGNVSLPISRHRDGWRVGYKRGDGTWGFITRKDKQEAITEGRKKAVEIQHGAIDFNRLTDGERSVLARVARMKLTHADVDAWESFRSFRSRTVSEVLAAMVQEKTAARGEKGIYLKVMQRDLATLPQLERIGDITPAQITSWLDSARAGGAGQRRLKNLRDSAVTLFRWAQKHGDLPEGKTAPERTEAIVEGRKRGEERSIEIYTPGEFQTVYNTVPDYWRPFVVLAAFAGLRTEELMPAYRTAKDGLDWRDVRREQGVIRVPASVSKTGHARVVPILPNLEAWLAHLNVPAHGPIIPGSPSNADNDRRASVKGWKKNALRHSFGTYRTAQTQNLFQVALEMGNSPPIIRKHYLEAVPKAHGEAWFSIVPA